MRQVKAPDYYLTEDEPTIFLAGSIEMGKAMFAKDEKLIVCCPEGFWRKGNIEVVCDWYEIPLYTNFEEAIVELLDWTQNFRDGKYAI